ncbi:MFS transporter [candidate division KSB1 bacterium]
MHKMNKKNIALLSLGHFSVDLYAGFLRPILPLLMTKFGVGIFAVTLISSFAGAAADVSQPLFGYLSDKFRKPVFIIAGPLVAGLFIPLMGIAPNYYFALIFAFLGSLGVASYHPQGAAAVGISSGTKKEKGMAFYVTTGSFGFSAGPLLVVMLISIGGLSYISLSIIPPIVFSLVMFKYFKRQKVASKVKTSLKSAFLNVRGPVLILIFIVTLRAFIIMAYTTFIPILVDSRGGSLEFGGITLSLMHLIGSSGGFFGGVFADKIGPKKIIVFSFLISTPFLYYYMFLDGLFSIVVLCIGTFIIFSSVPVVVSYAQTIMPSHIGTISSFMMGFCWGLASFLLIPFGALAEKYGIQIILQLISLTAVIGGAASLFLKNDSNEYELSKYER